MKEIYKTRAKAKRLSPGQFFCEEAHARTMSQKPIANESERHLQNDPSRIGTPQEGSRSHSIPEHGSGSGQDRGNWEPPSQVVKLGTLATCNYLKKKKELSKVSSKSMKINFVCY